MKRAAFALATLFVLVALSPAGAADPGERKSYTKTFPFGAGKESKVGIRQGPVTIETARIRNWPDADDFADAENDADETHTMVVEFEYSNRDEARDWKCRYTVTVPGKDGGSWAENDRTATLDSGKVHDTNKVFVRMKTRNYKRATSYRVTFEIWKD